MVGQSNRFAHAAALAVAETPAKSYNPLFIYGDAGLGKTHLLHAIGHYVYQNFANLDVCYVSTETFLNEFIDSIRTGLAPAADLSVSHRVHAAMLACSRTYVDNHIGFAHHLIIMFDNKHRISDVAQ